MRTEVEDNWIAVVDRFAASNLSMIFVGQTGLLMRFADFDERLCDIVKTTSLSYFVTGRCFQAISLIHVTLLLFMFSQGCILLQHNISYATKKFLSPVEIHV